MLTENIRNFFNSCSMFDISVFFLFPLILTLAIFTKRFGLLRKISSVYISRTLVATIFLVGVYLRFKWTYIARVMPDEASNIWLGYTLPLSKMKLGLVSSKGVPNPAGMFVFSKILTVAPGLFISCFLLSLLHFVALIFFSYRMPLSVLNRSVFFLLFSVSTVLIGTSFSIWNNFVFILFNCFLFLPLIKASKSQLSFADCLLVVLYLFFIPSVYFPGIANSVSLGIVFIFILIQNAQTRRAFLKARNIMIVLGLITAIIYVVWLPFLSDVPIASLSVMSPFTLTQRFRRAINTIIELKNWHSVFEDRSLKPLEYTHGKILTQIPSVTLTYYLRIIFIQKWTLKLLVLTMLLGIGFKNIVNFGPIIQFIRSLRYVLLFFILVFVFNSFFGGYLWEREQRADQSVQFYPLYLMFYFVIPALIIENLKYKKVKWFFKFLTTFTIISFVWFNIALDLSLPSDHLQYSKDFLSGAEVPLVNKLDAARWVADGQEAQKICTMYNFNNSELPWLADFEIHSDKYFKGVWRVSRAFDYELLRHYKTTNLLDPAQSNEKICPLNNMYYVTYAWLKEPKIKGWRVIQSSLFSRIKAFKLGKDLEL